MADVVLILTTSVGDAQITGVWTRVTDVDGYYAFSAIPAGEYTLRVDDPQRRVPTIILSVTVGQEPVTVPDVVFRRTYLPLILQLRAGQQIKSASATSRSGEQSVWSSDQE
jgi:hypothetical protein